VSFVHEDPEFDDLLQIVADARKLSRGLIEKDYWVTHTLWVLHAAGLDVWFKGGTSLSKGFGLIERFSEDLDLKIEPGTVDALPKISNWRSDGTKATAERKAYFEKLRDLIVVPGARIVLDPDSVDKTWRGADIQVHYPARHLVDLGGAMSPFIRLEVGNARVTPFVPCTLTSFVHERLGAQNQFGDYDDNRPKGVRCVHPFVTLLEKFDALHRRFLNEKAEPATFVRHYEDAAHVISKADNLPPLMDHADVRALAAEMVAQRQILAFPSPSNPALAPAQGPRWDAIHRAHTAIGQIFWGPRIAMDDACATMREWATATFS